MTFKKKDRNHFAKKKNNNNKVSFIPKKSKSNSYFIFHKFFLRATNKRQFLLIQSKIKILLKKPEG